MDEMSESPVAPDVARGVQDPLYFSVFAGPGSPGCPKRKRAYRRAIKAKRDIPGLLDFMSMLMIQSVTEKMFMSLVDEIKSPSPLLGLLANLAEKNAPAGPCSPAGYSGIKVEWQKND